MRELRETAMQNVFPIVHHNLWEWGFGMSPLHVLAQATLQAYLTGRGVAPRDAIRQVEAWEHEVTMRQRMEPFYRPVLGMDP